MHRGKNVGLLTSGLLWPKLELGRLWKRPKRGSGAGLDDGWRGGGPRGKSQGSRLGLARRGCWAGPLDLVNKGEASVLLLDLKRRRSRGSRAAMGSGEEGHGATRALERVYAGGRQRSLDRMKQRRRRGTWHGVTGSRASGTGEGRRSRTETGQIGTWRRRDWTWMSESNGGPNLGRGGEDPWRRSSIPWPWRGPCSS